MALHPGTRIGPYEILSALGAGGMGEVYRARDTKLNRDVAIKVLLPAVADDPERLARFSREAQLLASLNHPNIAHIHGLEDSGGTRALVMELVEGSTLEEHIGRRAGPTGPAGLPLDEALAIAKQIAEALEAAHEQGVIHRDLKPANIKVRPDGTVKVLDFGLAKLTGPPEGGHYVPGGGDRSVRLQPDRSMSPTITSPAMMTGAGMILGTAAYMSPEQAKGKPADKRSDIWGFGCVLFELLTGRRAFEGDDVTDVMVAVLSKEPAWSALPASVPPSIRVLLRRCLQKDRTLRLQAAGDARVEIQEALSGAGTPEPVATPQGSVLGLGGVALGLGCRLAGSVVAGLAVWNLKPIPPQPVSRLAMTLPSGERLPALLTPLLALSPDGTRIAFLSAGEGGRQIYVRAFDSTESKAIPGSENAESVFFSPDGRWLGFVAGRSLMKVSMDGGAPVTICEAPNVRGASWGDNDTIVFAAGFGAAGLSRVPADGGTPEAITSRDTATEEEAHRWPQVLPDGNAVLFTAWNRNLDDAEIVVQRLDTGERRVILRGGTYARYVSAGLLVYARAGTLMAVPFDLSRLETAGDPMPVVQGVSLTTEGAAQFDVSRTGSLVYVPGGAQASERRLVWVDRSGTEQPTEAPPRGYANQRVSPDGQQIAVTVQGANDDVWVYNIPRQTLTRLTSLARSMSPSWTYDGKRIIYRSVRGGTLNLFARAADGSGDEERLTESRDNETPLSTSPDGQTLVFSKSEARDLWILPLTGDRKPRPFFTSPFTEGGGAFSPDGLWLAYWSDESGRNEIYVQPFPGGGRKVQISRDGGAEPRWSRGGELFYRAGDRVMVVELTTQPTLAVGQPRMVFEGQYAAAGGSSFDVTSDGQRLLMMKESEQAASAAQINVVLNWTSELQRLVPAR